MPTFCYPTDYVLLPLQILHTASNFQIIVTQLVSIEGYVLVCILLCCMLIPIKFRYLIPTVASYSYHTWEKLEWEKIGEQKAICQFLLTNYFSLSSVVAIYAAHFPIFYPPIGSDQPIHQCFTLPNCPHLWYKVIIQLL